MRDGCWRVVLSLSFGAVLILSIGFFLDRPVLGCLICGLMLVLCLPPVGFFPFFFVSISCFLLLLRRAKNIREAFFFGYVLAFAYFLGVFYWTIFAFSELLAEFRLFAPVAFFGVPFVLSFGWGLASAGAYLVRTCAVSYVLMYAALLVFAEYFRSGLLVDTPWAPIAMGWYRFPAMMQVLSISGVYLLGFLTVLFAAMPFLWHARQRVFCMVIISLFIACALWGYGRYAAPIAYDHDANIQIVQPAIDDWQDDVGGLDEQVLSVIEQRLSTIKNNQGITISLWPEAMFSIHRDQDDEWRRRIADAMPDHTYVALGVRRVIPKPEGARVYNSLLILDQAGDVVDVYDKFHLTPWSEKIPYEGFVRHSPLAGIVAHKQSLTRGNGARVISLEGVGGVIPQICYDSAYPGYLPDVNVPPRLIMMSSYDDWTFGTSHPYQGFEMARMRAIETGVPVARAANSGISALFDGRGRVVDQVQIGRRGEILSPLPRGEVRLTPYVKWRDGPVLGLCGLIVFMIGMSYLFGNKKGAG